MAKKLLSLAVALSVGMFLMQTALAVHDTGTFELDGDATNGLNTAGVTGSAGDDFDNVCYTHAIEPASQGGLGLSASDAAIKCGTSTGATTATATAWVEEPNPASSIFTGGGSKDPQDISNWLWKNDANNPPDKDNLVHAYAARYSMSPSSTCPSGTAATCDVMFFGSDRFDNSGDAQQAFWFLQNKVTLTSTSSQGGFTFSGVHKAGDLLIISDFSNGGTTSTISVYRWDPLCTADGKPDASCKAANLRLLQDLQGDTANCAKTTTTGDTACGIVNPTTISMPWSFADKSGTANNGALQGEFYEAGINLSVLNLSGECFSTLVAESRSATSPTATLKDFVLGQFAVCAPALTTDVQGLDTTRVVLPGTQVRDLATVTVTGATTPPDATGTVNFFLCGPGTSSTPSCSSGGTAKGANIALADISNPGNTSDGISGAYSSYVNTASSPLSPGYYCFRAEASLTNYDSPGPHTNSTTECFQVKDTSSLSTAQRWVPNDSTTVLLSGGSAAAGSVTFSLYENGTCSGTAAATFGPLTLDSNGSATTNNVSAYVATTTISWKVAFTPTDPNVTAPTPSCRETSTVTITN